MKHLRNQIAHCLGLTVLLSAIGLVRTMGGVCMVSDFSKFGSKVAFVYNGESESRLVVIDEQNRHRYEAPLVDHAMAPFWEAGKVYVIGYSGNMQEFSIGTDKLVPEKDEKITSTGVVREYTHSGHRLYLTQTYFDDRRKVFYQLSVIDFPSRKTLWTVKVDDPGLLRVIEPYLCMTGLKLVQVFNCDTGEKIGKIKSAKAVASLNTEGNNQAIVSRVAGSRDICWLRNGR